MLSKLAVRRLSKLADYMANLPKWADKHFNMNSVAYARAPLSKYSDCDVSLSNLKRCGTTACAMGWAGTIPSFRKSGFIVQLDNRGGFTRKREEEFFDITKEQARFLFYDPQDISTPKEWASYCRNFIKANR